MVDTEGKSDIRVMSMHTLRRVFLHYIEQGWYYQSVTDASSIDDKKRNQYNLWFRKQFFSFKDILIDFINSKEDIYHAVSIRTLLELIKFDSLLENGPEAISEMNIESWKRFIMALVISKNELDIDLLLMLKDEILGLHHDLVYFSFITLKDIILEVKEVYQESISKRIIVGSNYDDKSSILTNFDVIRKNCIDLVRIISIPDDIDINSFWIPLQLKTNKNKYHNGNNTSDEDNNDDTDSSDEEREENKRIQTSKNNIINNMNPLLAELAGLKNNENSRNKRKNNNHLENKKKKNKNIEVTLEMKLQNIAYYQKKFSKTWLALLSLPFTSIQHKLLLKHLPEYVIPMIKNPMLLADYLTQSYKVGGIVSVLALESLFVLILNYNLDYPDFFLSLYNLCTVEVFSAKYRNKFMKLLSTCLKSSNLPVYLVSSFIKRLAHLALHTPTPNTQYCIAQCTWLLRQHPQTQVLIHRELSQQQQQQYIDKKEFNNIEEKDLNKSNAIHSSLWEIECLQNHHLYKVSAMALALMQPLSTTIGPEAGTSFIHVEDYLNNTYNDLIEVNDIDTNKKMKKNHALSYIKPTTLIDSDDAISRCFTIG